MTPYSKIHKFPFDILCKERMVQTHTYSILHGAESGLKASPPAAITSLLRIQYHLLSVKNGYFKRHYFTNKKPCLGSSAFQQNK
jgi:hypothetical protein